MTTATMPARARSEYEPRQLHAQDINLEISPDATQWLANRGYQPEYGARPLRRSIQREWEDRLSTLLLDDGANPGDTIEVNVVGGELDLSIRPAAVPAGT
ncbi:hypothetical protein [Micromonospora coxensis]|uniref:hypothetical protein n=1 Tax=Micromonospora coxensis TaxID=356852 RepID=UPI001E3DDDE4|nr:hypothetical protein [Micromonospora coxensis]